MNEKLQLMGKLMVVILLVCYMQNGAFAQLAFQAPPEKEDLDIQKRSLKSVLLRFQERHKVSLSFQDKDVENKTVDAELEYNSNVEEALGNLLKPLGLKYEKIKEGVYVISKKERETKEDSERYLKKVESKGMNTNERLLSKMPPKLAPTISTMFQDVTVSGTVTSLESGEPLPGVNVLIKGTTKGTVTDISGNYTLNAPEDGILVFSFIGYTSEEVPVNSRSMIDVALVTDIQSLDELVVVGYGKQKKSSITAAISTLEGNKIDEVPVANLSNALGGRLSGLIVRQASGQPGEDNNSIYIRGIGTTGNTSPLLVVDGIPRGFQNLDPNTVESITVLKDAAAVAPYGVAGANGVILVTTKRGETGAPVLTYSGSVGYQNPTVLPETMTSYEFAKLKNAANINVGKPPIFTADDLQKFKDGTAPNTHTTQNIYDMLFAKNAPMTSHTIGLSGGTDRVRYYGSIGYLHQAGLWAPTYKDRFNYSLNMDADVTPSTNVSFGIIGRKQVNHSPPIRTLRLFELIHYATNITRGPILYTNGKAGENIWNSVFESGYSQTDISQLYTQLSIEQELPFIPGLKAEAKIAFDPTYSRNKSWRTPVHRWSVDTSQTPYVYIGGILGQRKPSLSQSMNYSQDLTFQGSLRYSATFGKSDIGGLALFESRSGYGQRFGANRRNYNLSVAELNMGSSDKANLSNSGTSNKARQVGLIYRATYDYADKYLVEVSGRYDGSYYFAEGKRFGFFPAFSLGWRLSEENFMQNISWIDYLKIRGSYGEVGALAGAAFQYLSLYSIYGPATALDGAALQAASEGRESNPNITWERAKKTNIGLEVSLWNRFLTLEADYFYGHRSNMLTSPNVTVPLEYGIGLSQVNAGEMENKGVDLKLSSTFDVSNLHVTVGGTFTYAKNELLQVFETGATYNNPNRRRTGRPLGTKFGYEAVGYFQVEDFDDSGNLLPGIATQPWGQVFPGDLRYRDINNDGKIDNDDKTAIGFANIPQIIYGMFSHITYKDFSLDVLFQGAGRTDFYGPRGYWQAFWNNRGAYKSNLDYWTPENTDASHARITPAPRLNNEQKNSHFVFSTRYLRLKSASLSYTLPESVSRKVGIGNAKIYCFWAKPIIVHANYKFRS